MKTALKLPPDNVNKIAFYLVHRFGANQPNSTKPRAIVAKMLQAKRTCKKKMERTKGDLPTSSLKKFLRRKKTLFNN